MYHKSNMPEGQEIPIPPQPNQEQSPFGSGALLKEYIRKERQPVDYGKIITSATRVLALGENHSRDISKKEIVNNIKRFKELGFTHLGMEMFETEFQPVLDEYQKSGENKEEVAKHLKKGYGYWSPHGNELYLQIVDQATQAGIRVIALDIPASESEQYKNDPSLKKLKKDEKMAATARDTLDRNPNHKMITFSGSKHVEKSGKTMANLLAAGGVDIVSVNIEGGKSKGKDKMFEEEAAKAGVANERFMVASLAKFSNFVPQFDWLIHLPQVEAETSIEKSMRESEESFTVKSSAPRKYILW